MQSERLKLMEGKKYCFSNRFPAAPPPLLPKFFATLI
jgi:hypothetical protein